MSVLPREKTAKKIQSSLNFCQPGPRKFSKSDFSGLAPIRRALIFVREFSVIWRDLKCTLALGTRWLFTEVPRDRERV